MALKVERTKDASGADVLQLTGPLTLGREAQSFESSLDAMVKAGQTNIVLDMAGVPYVDSAGIGILVGSHGKVANAGGQLKLSGVTDRVRQVFRLTKVDTVLALVN